ncbi:MAG TPA: SDR family oxidoreductase, partial [Saprospiraceae bacterium]|nr:SDR family oxidoreductase [Saprospiraceae bacterium]
GDIPPSVTYIRYDVLNDEFPINEMPEIIDGLVYCPGSIVLKPFKSIKVEQFTSDFEINVLGAIKVLQAVLPRLSKSANPASVVLYSTVAVGLGMPFHASISASKGAIEGLTRTLASELSPKIRVNAIAPSLTETPLSAGLLSTDERKQRSAEMHPMKRFGNAGDIAKMTCFLLSADSSWITGQIIGVDGGLSSLKVN